MKPLPRALAVLLALMMAVGCTTAGESDQPQSQPEPITPPDPLVMPEAGAAIRMVVSTDIHLIAPELVEDGEPFQTAYMSGDGKQINYTSDVLDAFIEQVLEEAPDVLVITGDLSLDGEKKSHQELATRLLEVRRGGIGVYVIPGNHDINNGYAAGFGTEKKYNVEATTPEEFADIYRYCGYGEALQRDENSLSYLAEVSPDLWLLMMDTNKYDYREQMGLPPTGGDISPETLAWMEQCLELAREAGVQVVAASHHNLVDHSTRIRKDYTLDNADEVLALYDKYGVVLNLSGHIHMQSVASAKLEHEIFDITTTALCVYDHQYGQLEFRPGEVIRYNVKEVDVESWAFRQNSHDENLLNFEEYSYKFFYDVSYERSIYNLYMDQVPYEEAEIMAQTMALLNPAYFSGHVADIREDILASDHYAMWKQKGGMVSFEYNDSMLVVPEYDPCEVEILLTNID